MAIPEDRRGVAHPVLVALCLYAYWGVAFGAGEHYPVSPLAMFSGEVRTASRLVARTADGTLCDVSDFDGWHCRASISESLKARTGCPRDEYTPYDDITADHVRSHPGAPGQGQEVEIVRQVFAIPDGRGEHHMWECPVVTCRALARIPRCGPVPAR